MAVTNIPNVQNWTVTPQNGQPSYFTLMNTWLGQSTLVIASLQTAIAAQNIANSEINALAIQTENNAIIANGLANFKGSWSGATTYSKGQSVESTSGSKIYYTSKVDNNLNHSLTDTNYWLYSPINDKLDKDFSILTDKATPADTDIFAIRETGGLLKKLSWANLKATLKTYFDSLYMSLTGNQTVSGVKTFNSSPWVPNPAVIDYSNNAATTAFVSEKISAFFAAPNVSLASNGYQKLPSGLIIQWGISTNTSYQTYQTFPLVFPNALYSLTANSMSSNLAVATNNYIIATGNTTKSAFYWNGVDHNGSIQSTAGNLQIIYIAIGY